MLFVAKSIKKEKELTGHKQVEPVEPVFPFSQSKKENI